MRAEPRPLFRLGRQLEHLPELARPHALKHSEGCLSDVSPNPEFVFQENWKVPLTGDHVGHFWVRRMVMGEGVGERNQEFVALSVRPEDWAPHGVGASPKFPS